MKKGLLLLVILCLATPIAIFAENVDNSTYFQGCIEKTKMGFTNTLTGVLEIPFQMKNGWQDGLDGQGSKRIVACLFGSVRGAYHGLGRTANGLIQLFTFALPNPKNNDGIGVNLDGRYVWDRGKQYSIVNNGLRPMGRKVTRGVINGVYGLLDGPGQIIKGIKQGNPFLGLAKAIPYGFSRAAYGAYEIITCALPNNVETFGYAYSEKQPWDCYHDASIDNDK